MNEEIFETQVYIVNNEVNGLRIDKALTILNPLLSRSHVQNLIENGNVLLNNYECKASTKVKVNDEITLIDEEENFDHLAAEDIPLDIVYEDDDILVINKPRGMVVHPAAGNYSKTLVNALLFHYQTLSKINDNVRPGIVHRLDKDTTGLLVVAKTDFAHDNLAQQLKERSFKKIYTALVKGEIKENEGTINAPIGRHPSRRKEMAVVSSGKSAITHFKVIERFYGYTLLRLNLITGRTHQIRVHLNYINHPLVGDPVYGSNNKSLFKDGQLLHAKELSFLHPRTNQVVSFNSNLPDDFMEVLRKVRGNYEK